MSTRVRVEGTAATVRAFTLLGNRVAKNVMAKAVRAGAKPHLAEARRRVPRVNRLLVRSLVTIVRRYPSGASATIGQEQTAGLKSRAAHAKAIGKKKLRSGGISGQGNFVPIHLLESPVKSHRIAAKTARTLMFTVGGKQVVARAVNHPGHRGGGHLASASKAAFANAQRATEAKLEVEVAAEANKLVTF